MRTRVKICCISSVAEARTAVAAGADAIGLVSAMPSGPGVIDEDLIADIAAAAPPAIGTFLLTSEVEPASIIGHAAGSTPSSSATRPERLSGVA